MLSQALNLKQSGRKREEAGIIAMWMGRSGKQNKRAGAGDSA